MAKLIANYTTKQISSDLCASLLLYVQPGWQLYQVDCLSLFVP